MQQKQWTKKDRIKALLARVGMGATIESPNGLVRVSYDAGQIEDGDGPFVFTMVQPTNGDVVRPGVSYDKIESQLAKFKAADIMGYKVISGTRLVRPEQEATTDDDDGLETVTPEQNDDRNDKQAQQGRERINMPETTTSSDTTNNARNEAREGKKAAQAAARAEAARAAFKGVRGAPKGDPVTDPSTMDTYPKVPASERLAADVEFKTGRYEVPGSKYAIQVNRSKDGVVTMLPVFDGSPVAIKDGALGIARRLFVNALKPAALEARGVELDIADEMLTITPKSAQADEDAPSADEDASGDDAPAANGEAA